MTRLARIALLGLAGCIVAASYAQQTIYVNGTTGDDGWDGLCEEWDGGTCGPKATIQAGIDAAQPGDTVTVADGIYTGTGNKNLDYHGKAITVRSADGPDACIIDCEDDGRGIVFQNGEPAEARLQGLTIRNGNAMFGGGIYCEYGAPTVADCVIANNFAYDGGGIYTRFCLEDGLKCHSCKIIDNIAYWDGGGVYCTSAGVTITDCEIVGNTARWLGGGVCARQQGWCHIYDTDIRDNRAEGIGVGSNGGGLCIDDNSSLDAYRCVISGNVADDAGGGAYGYLHLRQSWICGNLASDGAGCFLLNGRLDSCVIAGNTARSHGGGLYCLGTSYVCTCTITQNAAMFGGGAYGPASPPTATVNSSIIWANSYGDAGGVDREHCLVGVDPQFICEDGPDGDPLTWADNDYHLTAGSPCVDSGDPQYVENSDYRKDIDEQKRVWNGDGVADQRVDIGADEYGSFVYGDLNCNGMVDLFDVDPFALSISNAGQYNILFPDCDIVLADMSNDDDVNLFDIDPFVELLTGE